MDNRLQHFDVVTVTLNPAIYGQMINMLRSRGRCVAEE